MMKALLLGLGVMVAGTAMANDEAQLTDELVQLAAEAKYISIDCDIPLDKDKFIDLTKIYAFNNGYDPKTEINWEYVKLESHKLYMTMKSDLPHAGQACDSLTDKFKDALPALQKKPALDLDI
ncbi:hypothetical protein GCM10011369_23710 [Neiella marina]|uniref:HdeA/HdeB family protein n=1 Tax=Neiella marina TaxID=508461 RepID=A0A8J2XPL3_9GAMM|nr:hypothetical protein [Neiella marina]GGA81010.1 hypothetical protein GCM10011369_23710 [Neiella marina]